MKDIHVVNGGRIQFVDLAKGVCILLVVMFHVGIEIPYLDIVRMPLYFILSGMFFKEYSGFFDFTVRKTNKILIPFVTFYIVGYICFYLIKFLSPDSNLIDKGIFDVFTTSHHVFNTPVWFLLCLFWVSILFYACKIASTRTNKKSLTMVVSVLVISVLGQVLNYFNIRLPLFIDCALSSLPFYYFGYILRKSNILLPSKFDKYNWITALGLFSITIAATIILSLHVDIQYNRIPILCYAVSTIGVLSILFICKIFNKIPLVSYIGRYSIIILVTHNLIYRFLKLVAQKLSFTPDYFEWYQFVFVVMVSLMVIPLCIKYLPKVTAQEDMIIYIYINEENNNIRNI